MRILMTHSFKGGSGKTIFSANIAKILAQQGSKVLLIETDFGMPAFYSIFTDLKPDIYLNDFLAERQSDLKQFIYSSTTIPGLDFIFADEVYDPTHKVFGRDQHWFQQSKVQLERALATLDYDYVIFDTTPGTSLFVINLLLITHEVYLLLRSDTQSIQGTKNLIDRIYKRTIDLGRNVDLHLVINQIPQVEEMGSLLDEISKSFKYTYPFVDKVATVKYEHATSYLTAINQFLLPPDNPTSEQILSLLKSTGLV